MVNNIINKISTFSRIKQIVTYFLLIASFISVIGGTTWGIANWVIEKDAEANISIKSFEKGIEIDSIQNTKIDLIINKLEKLDEIDSKVDVLQNSYILYMKNTLTTDDFRNYMEGITWELKKNN